MVVGLILGGAVAATVILRSRRDEGGPPPDVRALVLPEAALARRLLDLMDPAVVFVDVDDAVLLANPAARALGIVRGDRLLVRARRERPAAARSTGGRRAGVRLPGDLVGPGPRPVRVHAVRPGSGPARTAG